MTSIHAFAAAGLVAALSSACSFQFGSAERPTGRGVYAEACASCHGLDGKGAGAAATDLASRPVDLTALAIRSGGTFPREKVAEAVTRRPPGTHGPVEISVRGRRLDRAHSLAEGVAAVYAFESLLDYLESIQEPAARPAKP